MSKLISNIEVIPEPLNWDNTPEVIQIVDNCPSCKGVGNFKIAKGYHGSETGEFLIADCKRCNGSGRLKADVIIRWSPDEKVIE